MHNAPSVMYPVGRCAFHARVLLMLSILGITALCLLCWLYPAISAWLLAMGVCLWLAWSVVAGWSWWHAPEGRLQWDARASDLHMDGCSGAWRWSAAGAPPVHLERIDWVLDVQSVVLLRLLERRGGSSRWVWLEAARDPVRWVDLRRALTAHAQV